MLPDFETCWKHINIFNLRVKHARPCTTNFQVFWEYKTTLEATGEDILSDHRIEKTAGLLKGLLIYLRRQKAGVPETDHIIEVLMEIRENVRELAPVYLGSGRIRLYRDQLETVCACLGGLQGKREFRSSRVSIVSTSEILMALWGQVPRLDRLARRRFDRWTHDPAPLKLPYLQPDNNWYSPAQFSAIVEELDDWVAAWPDNNQGRAFAESFSDLCPGAPVGRQVDIIYHWEFPDPRVDYRLQSQST